MADLVDNPPADSVAGLSGAGSPAGPDETELWVETLAEKTGSGLTEVEIFSLLSHNLRSVADKCKMLAWHPRRGPIYLGFCKECDEIEGCCRQAAAHREDARWLSIGFQIAVAKRKAGIWVRGLPSRRARSTAYRLFLALAEALDKMAYDCEQLRTAATGQIGMILPNPLPEPHRDTRPLGVLLPSGLIVPRR